MNSENQLYFATMVKGDIAVSKDMALSEIPEAWHPIVSKLIDDMFAIGWNGRIDQIKEKFGGLRFYASNINDQMSDLIDEAEAQTTKICIVCGAPATGTTKGWYTHRCEEHKDA